MASAGFVMKWLKEARESEPECPVLNAVEESFDGMQLDEDKLHNTLVELAEQPEEAEGNASD